MDRKAQTSLIGGLIGVFLFAIVATALLPTIGDSVGFLTENASDTNLSSTERNLLDLWPTFIIIGGLLAILAAVGLR